MSGTTDRPPSTLSLDTGAVLLALLLAALVRLGLLKSVPW